MYEYVLHKRLAESQGLEPMESLVFELERSLPANLPMYRPGLAESDRYLLYYTVEVCTGELEDGFPSTITTALERRAARDLPCTREQVTVDGILVLSEPDKHGAVAMIQVSYHDEEYPHAGANFGLRLDGTLQCYMS